MCVREIREKKIIKGQKERIKTARNGWNYRQRRKKVMKRGKSIRNMKNEIEEYENAEDYQEPERKW